MSDMAKRLARLPGDRRAEFLAALRAASTAPAPPPSPRREPGAPAPLSYAQETLWFLDRLAPGQSAYNIGTLFTVFGLLDVDRLSDALSTVVRRQEALRSVLRVASHGPEQVVLPAGPVPLPVQNVEAGTHDVMGTVRQIAVEMTCQPFDLGVGPLIRAALLRLDAEHHVFVFVVHHVVFDGWSNTLFIEELSAAYTGEELPPLPQQYADHAIAERDRHEGGRLGELATFWRENLRGAPTVALPTDRPRPPVVTYAGAYRRTVLDPSVSDAVERLARSARVTPNVVYLAAFLVLLARYTGQTDLVVGSPTWGRDGDDVDRIIGFFVNMVALRADLSGDPSFRELLSRVSSTTTAAFLHADLPFGRVVDAARPARDPSRPPLFQIVFALQSGSARLSLPGLRVETEQLDTGASRFDLSWNVTPDPTGTVVEAEFNTDLFDAERVETLLIHYRRVLQSVLAAPELTVSGVPLLSEPEQQDLLTRWNGPRTALPEQSVPEVFATRVAENPEAVALVVNEVAYTYAELDRMSNRMARLLIDHGIRPGDRVALSLRRTQDLCVAVLAVLKAGAAYVPVDPGYPPARMRAILDDAEPAAVLTHADLVDRLPAVEATVLTLDTLGSRLESYSDGSPNVPTSCTDVAYALYTSGTTGRPKGVLIEHRSVVAFVDAMRELFELTPKDRMLGYASANFDVSVGEMFNALLTGGRLCLADDEQRLDMRRLGDLIEQAGITVADLPPTVMALLEPERFTSLRIVFVGGEAFPGALVNRWNQGRKFFNGYGPTECTVTMIVHECSGRWETSPPIGLPIANHVAHVVDEQFRLVPYGVVGECVIGGAGLTRGYLNDPELSARKIVPDPFGSTVDGRLYHTGDLVRRRRDGTLEFVGRMDNQVKIRGLRIELGDVEAATASYPGLGQLAVVVWTDPHGERHLVAYYTSAGQPVSRDGLRSHVAQRVPAHMVPAYFVELPALPLTVSSKVDHAALPDPNTDQLTGEGPLVEPRTETERRLAEQIFTSVLHRDRISIDDDFFQLGGNSLQAAHLMSRISADFDVDVRLVEFFRSPTVAHLASIIDRERALHLSDDQLVALIEGMSDEEAERMIGGDAVR